MYTHKKRIVTAGIPVRQAKNALIMIHGRGASAESIIPLSNYLHLKDTAIFAPLAERNSWYPTSFIEPAKINQPALDSALEVISGLVSDVNNSGIPLDQVYFLGFSQGACLTLEYVTRNAARYAGVIAFTGGLIGKELKMENYSGDFEQTLVLITTSDPDMHVPLDRVKETGSIMDRMNAQTNIKVYPRKPHTVTNEETDLANNIFFN